VELFDPLPKDLADLIQRDDAGEVHSWVLKHMGASQRDLDDFRFGNPRLFAQLRHALEHPLERPGEGSASVSRGVGATGSGLLHLATETFGRERDQPGIER
jgi:hypothetical protein